MTDRADALRALIEKVEAGGVTSICSDFYLCFGGKKYHFPSGNALAADRAYRGSLDAAKALHEVVLPGWKVATLNQTSVPDTIYSANAEWSIRLWNSSDEIGWSDACGAETPARAWLLAILQELLFIERTRDLRDPLSMEGES